MKNILGKICNIHFLPLILFFMGWFCISIFRPEFYWRVELLGIGPSSASQDQENFKPEEYQVELPSTDKPYDEPRAQVSKKNGWICLSRSEISYIENNLLKEKNEIKTNQGQIMVLLVTLGWLFFLIELAANTIYFIVSRNARRLGQVAIECIIMLFVIICLLTILGPVASFPSFACMESVQISAELIKITWVGQESLVIGVILVCLAFAVLILRNTTFRHQRFFVESQIKQDGQDA